MATKTGNGLTATNVDSRLRRGLVGLQEVGKPPTKPLEVLAVRYEEVDHAVRKQTGATCVNGIDKWWVETACGRRMVVTAAARIPAFLTCLECLMEGG